MVTDLIYAIAKVIAKISYHFWLWPSVKQPFRFSLLITRLVDTGDKQYKMSIWIKLGVINVFVLRML